MSRLNKPERPTQMELDILRSFGWAILELESVLFERYTQLSAMHSLISIENFRKALRTMESKGFLSSTNLHGNRALKKQIANGKTINEIAPRNPNEEMRLALASLKAKKGIFPSSGVSSELNKSVKPSSKMHLVPETASEFKLQRKVTRELIIQSQMTGEIILQQLEKLLMRKSRFDKTSRGLVSVHIHNLRRSLSDSEETFLKYIEDELPDLIMPLNRLLDAKGSDYVLLSLRMADSKVKKYL